MSDNYSGVLVAVLTCTAGEVMEAKARASLLESFGYEPASDDMPNLWMPMEKSFGCSVTTMKTSATSTISCVASDGTITTPR